jgi:hypothetical protein
MLPSIDLSDLLFAPAVERNLGVPISALSSRFTADLFDKPFDIDNATACVDRRTTSESVAETRSEIPQLLNRPWRTTDGKLGLTLCSCSCCKLQHPRLSPGDGDLLVKSSRTGRIMLVRPDLAQESVRYTACVGQDRDCRSGKHAISMLLSKQ